MSLTGKLGEYLNDLPRGTAGLSALPLPRYERILKLHTEAPSQPVLNNKQFYYYNILNKLEFPLNIESTLLSTYNVKSREPFTTISFKLYDDIDSWWMIYLLNKPLLKNKFYAEGGMQLKYIKKTKRGIIYQQITNTTAFSNRHF